MSKTEQELHLIVKCLPPSPFHDKADEVVERAITELRRLRISQLRRMAECAGRLCGNWSKMANLPWAKRRMDQYDRFSAACLTEIERLRGEG